MSNKCTTCKHFFVTWDQGAPRGCKLYNIKSRMFPSMAVAQASTEKDCLGYEKKEKFKERRPYE